MNLSIFERVWLFYYHKRGLSNLRFGEFIKCLKIEMKQGSKDVSYIKAYYDNIGSLYSFLMKVYPGVTMDTINKMTWGEVQFRVDQSRADAEATLLELEKVMEHGKTIQAEINASIKTGSGWKTIESDN